MLNERPSRINVMIPAAVPTSTSTVATIAIVTHSRRIPHPIRVAPASAGNRGASRFALSASLDSFRENSSLDRWQIRQSCAGTATVYEFRIALERNCVGDKQQTLRASG